MLSAALNSLEHSQSILRTDNPQEARYIGNKLPVKQVWDAQKDEKMYLVVLNKFSQNKELAIKLVATGNMKLYEATRCPYWASGLTLSSNEWAKGFIPGQTRLGDILMRVRDELRPLYQMVAQPTSDEGLSQAESLALTGSIYPSRPPPPHLIKEMVKKPPPNFSTQNRFSVLTEDSDMHSDKNRGPCLGAEAPPLHTSSVPFSTPVPSKEKSDVRPSEQLIDNNNPPVYEATSERASYEQSSAIDTDPATNHTDEGPSSNSQLFQTEAIGTQTIGDSDFMGYANYLNFGQYGFSPEKSDLEITPSKAKGFKAKLGKMFNRLSV